jgi:Holliday junction DNA helicase RuvA
MYEYLKGTLTDITPTYAIVEAAGVGYFVNISLQTYTEISSNKEVLLYIHQQIREDAHVLYGFAKKEERELFRLLIGVSGVGAATARIMLSSLKSNELTGAIASGNIATLKGIKGIGAKTAERIIVDLKDKVMKVAIDGDLSLPSVTDSSREAIAALIALGFAKPATEKAVSTVLKQDPTISVEELIRSALQRL